MKLELFDYQEAAAAVVSRHLIRAARDHFDDPADLTAVVLAAPTGAGKTVIATSVVEASLDGDESTPGIDDATFLWVTDDPSLNRGWPRRIPRRGVGPSPSWCPWLRLR